MQLAYIYVCVTLLLFSNLAIFILLMNSLFNPLTGVQSLSMQNRMFYLSLVIQCLLFGNILTVFLYLSLFAKLNIGRDRVSNFITIITTANIKHNVTTHASEIVLSIKR